MLNSAGKDLGFKSSLFNLVFANNASSVRLWRHLGFTELACIPKVANLKGSADLVDAYQFYFDFARLDNKENINKDNDSDSASGV
jgi:hypothetical protein